MDKAFEIQKQVRDNVKTFQTYLTDLQNWEAEMKRKEAALNGVFEQDLPPVRSKLKKEKPVVVKKKPETRISSYDYQSWDKFDVDKACEDVDMEEVGPVSLDSKKSQQAKQEKLREEAQYEKERGNTFVKQEKWDEAISCYSRAIELVQDDAIYYANRGLCYLKKESLHQAESDCTEALRLDPSYVKALQRRATARERLGSLRAASRDLAAVLQLEPRNRAARRQLDALTARMGTKGVSRVCCEVAVVREALQRRATARERLGSLRAASRDLAAVLQLEPRNRAARRQLDALTARMGTKGVSRVCCEVAVVREALQRRATARERLGSLRAASRDLAAVLQLEPRNRAARRQLDALTARMGTKGVSRVCCEVAVVREALQRRATARERLGSLRAASRDLAAVLQLEPRNRAARRQLDALTARMGTKGVSRVCCEVAVVREALQRRATARERLGSLRAASRDLAAVLQLEPRNRAARRQLDALTARMGTKGVSRVCCEVAVVREALQRRATARERLGSLRAASRDLAAVLQLEPRNRAARRQLDALTARMGTKGVSRVCCEVAVVREALQRRATARERLGSLRAASRDLAAVLQLEPRNRAARRQLDALTARMGTKGVSRVCCEVAVVREALQRRATARERLGSLRAASRDLAAVLQLEPRNRAARRQLDALTARMGTKGVSRVCCEVAVVREALQRRATARERLGSLRAASRDLAAVLQLEPRNRAARRQLDALTARMGTKGVSRVCCEVAVVREALQRRATARERLGSLRAASRDLAAVLQLEPRNRAARRQLDALTARMGTKGVSRVCCEVAVVREALQRRATARERLGSLRAASRDLAAVLQLEPRNRAARRQLDALTARMGTKGVSRVCCEVAVVREALQRRATARERLGSLRAASRDLAAVLQLEPRNRAARRQLDALTARMGTKGVSRVCCEVAVVREALQRRATARERLGSLRAASRDLAAVLQLEPRNRAARRQLDALTARMGTKGVSRVCCEVAVVREALQRRATARERLGSLRAASRDLAAVLQLEPRNRAARRQLDALTARMGTKGVSRVCCEVAVVREALQRRATARERLGSLRAASRDLAAVLQLEPRNRAARRQLDALTARMGTKGSKSKSSPSPSPLSTPTIESKPMSPLSQTKIVELPDEPAPPAPSDQWRDGVGENIMVIKPVKKPPHLRSKRPLKHIPIQEILLGKTSPDKPPTRLKIIELEDDLAHGDSNNNKNETTEVNLRIHEEKGKGDMSSPESVKLITDVTDTEKEKLIEEMKLDGKLEMETGTEGKLETGKEEKLEVAQEESVHSFLPPVNSVQFMSEWKYLKDKGDARSDYLSIIDPSKIPSIFANALESDVLSDVIEILNANKDKFREKTVSAYLKGVCAVKRFFALAMFLTDRDKKLLTELLHHCKTVENISDEDLADLKNKYEI